MKEKNKSKSRSIGSKALGNRTIIGIICIIAALAICFGVAPMVNRISDGKAEVVRVKQTIPQGSMITEDVIEVINVGSYNLPEGALSTKESVVGKFAKTDMYAGDYIFESKISSDVDTAKDILGSLVGDKKVISVTIGSFAQGLSGKLETGDIISAIVYSSKDESTFTPDALRYVMVVTSTTSKGIDKADVTDNTQPVTVTLLVNQEQAELLAEYEKTASMHFALEFRGDSAIAQQYLDEQQAYFDSKVGE
jgi:pilus assembly protein CpaB